MVEKILLEGDCDGIITKSEIVQIYGQQVLNAKEIVIGDNVKYIETEVFMGCKELEAVTLGENIEYISFRCFKNCVNLKTVDFSKCKKLLHISSESFARCSSLNNIIMPKSLTFIDDRAFCDCESLSHCILNDGLKTISTLSFAYCHEDLIKNIHIPNSVTTLYYNSFSNMSMPEYVDTWCIDYNGHDGVFRIKDGTKYIAIGVFENNIKVKRVILPDSVKTIESRAFYCDSIEEIEIGKGVTYIGESAIKKDRVKKIYYRGQISDWLKVGNSGCLYCDEFIIDGKTVEHLIIPNGIKKIPSNMFAGIKSITEVTLPSTVEIIKRWAFGYTSIKKINGGENVMYIGANAFYEVYRNKKYDPPYPQHLRCCDEEIISYKGFNADMSCNGFYYREGQTYTKDGTIEICARGFHSCPNPINIFDYYYNTPIIHKVRCKDIIYNSTKICCAEIEILEQLTYQDVFRIFNEINSKNE